MPLLKETLQPSTSHLSSFVIINSFIPICFFNLCLPIIRVIAWFFFSSIHMASKATATKDDSQQSSGSGGRKPAAAAAAAATRPQEQALKCPRCDSPNTKFCYYNNYSLSQPRHFCKTCRRYWTRGGALRSVPIGGGCRKNKKMKSSSSSSSASRLSGDSTGSSGIGGFKFFNNLSPAMDFQLGGLNFSTLNNPPTTGLFDHYSTPSPVIPSNPCFNLDPPGTSAASSLLGFNFSFPSMLKRQGENSSAGFQEMGPNVHHQDNLASSIESLSSINQELHWKLQQQRLAMFFGGENQKEIVSTANNSSLPVNQSQMIQKPQPILFQNLEISKPEAFDGKDCGGGNGSLATEWLFDNTTYAQVNHPSATTNTAGGNGSGNGNENSNNWNGFQAWSSSNMNQYSSLP